MSQWQVLLALALVADRKMQGNNVVKARESYAKENICSQCKSTTKSFARKVSTSSVKCVTVSPVHFVYQKLAKYIILPTVPSKEVDWPNWSIVFLFILVQALRRRCTGRWQTETKPVQMSMISKEKQWNIYRSPHLLRAEQTMLPETSLCLAKHHVLRIVLWQPIPQQRVLQPRRSNSKKSSKATATMNAHVNVRKSPKWRNTSIEAFWCVLQVREDILRTLSAREQ